MTLTYDNPITDLGLKTQAPKALAEVGITTVGQLLAKGRNRIADLRGMGNARLADIDDAITRHHLTWHARADLGKWNTCTSCPTCPVCGNPRATEARQVVVDLDGRAVHHGGRTADGPCHECDSHHRALVATRALELTGRLV